MQVNRNKVREKLQSFKFIELLREELGWDKPGPSIPPVTQNGIEFTLLPVAQKRGVQVFLCTGSTGELPDYPIRKIIESKVRKFAHEHLIIFVDRKKSVQRWQWVKREPNKPLQVREFAYDGNKAGELLVQRLEELAVSLDEEEKITLVDVTGKMRQAFDRDKVTKRFYDEFKKQRDNFAKFLKGIPTGDMEPWYVSVMLNRLMFIYFIQKKGFLNSDQNYLKVKLSECQSKGKDRYYTNFLCPLFFEGFAKKGEERSAEHKKLLGDIPYLNGGLFLKHQIEELHGQTIEICDKAFEHIFEFFDRYNWHLDERPLKNDKEINPEVLGFIFEKYINQKQMGAYYTKEDITGYITKNTVIPYLFDAARKECKIAFEGEHAVWRLLKNDPNAYIYDAVKKGVEKPLPPEIEAGITDVSKRGGWNKPADEELALPTEIWREVVARRQRYQGVHAKLANGDIQSINDLITYNLDIRQFAQDVIENCEGPELLRAFWKAISEIKVLDPTCGSGAFLFAALNILEPLYEACLDRMQSFVDDLDRSGQKHSPEKFKVFRETLERINQHPNRGYFIFKSIIVNNLFGVDIMEEAVEICKLRLFLKLVAQVDDKNKIEPLPDIDFNIRAGNTLIGFANFDEVKKATEGDLVKQMALPLIQEKAEDVSRLSQYFREQQTELGGEVTLDDKYGLRDLLQSLDAELNAFLASSYGVDPRNTSQMYEWVTSHKPFHWYTEFFEIMNSGGFDVIIGNPPYVEYAKVRRVYRLLDLETMSCNNLYAYVLERSMFLMRNGAYQAFIVPLAGFSTDRMTPLQQLFFANSENIWLSNYESTSNPTVLFVGVKIQLSIIVSKKRTGTTGPLWVTNYLRSFAAEREFLFSKLCYHESYVASRALPRVYDKIEFGLLDKLWRTNTCLGKSMSTFGTNQLWYRNMGNFFFKLAFLSEPPYFVDGHRVPSSTVSNLSVDSAMNRDLFVGLINSTLFYYYWILYSDCYHLSKSDIAAFPLDLSAMTAETKSRLSDQTNVYLASLEKAAVWQEETKSDGTHKRYRRYFPQVCKSESDKIDRILCTSVGLTDLETDFVISYDIKYRIGQNSVEDEE